MMKKFVIAFFIVLTGTITANAGTSLPALWKSVGNYNPADGNAVAETSIVVDQSGVINGGKPFTITFQCGDETTWPPPPANTPTLLIRDYFTKTVLKKIAWPNGGYRGFAVNKTINGLVHIFGTQDPSSEQNQNAFVHSTLDATFMPTTGVVILQSNLYGSGIKDIASFASPTPQGGWSVNYANPSGVGMLSWPDANFTPGQQSPSNPNGWTNAVTGQPFSSTMQAPDADYQASDGYWYAGVQNLESSPELFWVTMGRSSDLIHWSFPTTPLLVPDMPALEGIDASDVRMAEYQGTTYIIYLCGDQATWSNIRTAVFYGTIAQLRAQFF